MLRRIHYKQATTSCCCVMDAFRSTKLLLLPRPWRIADIMITATEMVYRRAHIVADRNDGPGLILFLTLYPSISKSNLAFFPPHFLLRARYSSLYR